MDDEICRSAADVQLVSCISDSNPSILLNHSINSFKVCCSWSDQDSWAVNSDTCSATVETFHHWYTFLCIVQSSPYCAKILLWLGGFTPSDCKNWMTARCWTMLQSKSRASTFMIALDSLHAYTYQCSMHDVCKDTVWHTTRILHSNCAYFWIPFLIL
jgi:hypothetical protein